MLFDYSCSDDAMMEIKRLHHLRGNDIDINHESQMKAIVAYVERKELQRELRKTIGTKNATTKKYKM